MDVFLSLPITSNLNKQGVFRETERLFFQGLLDVFSESGIGVFSAVVNEDWGKRKLSVPEFTEYDVASIFRADALVVVTRDRLTRDIMLEIGFAAGQQKLVIVALPEDAWTTHILDGLVDLGIIQILRFDRSLSDGRSLADKLMLKLVPEGL